VTKYPITANGFRLRSLSLYNPENSLAKLEKPSASPSMSPKTADPAPTEASNAGIAEVAISCPTSEKKLASPIPRTVEFSHLPFGPISVSILGIVII
jgi:hypothetical protein